MSEQKTTTAPATNPARIGTTPQARPAGAASGPRTGSPAGARPGQQRKPGGFQPRRFFQRPRGCQFCKGKEIDYRDIELLKSFQTDRGKMVAKRLTGVCTKHQRKLSVAVKRSRILALIPYTALHAQ